jgi:hypothetical protein
MNLCYNLKSSIIIMLLTLKIIKGVIMLKDLRLSLERQLSAISKNLNFSYPTSSFYHTTMFWCLSH